MGYMLIGLAACPLFAYVWKSLRSSHGLWVFAFEGVIICWLGDMAQMDVWNLEGEVIIKKCTLKKNQREPDWTYFFEYHCNINTLKAYIFNPVDFCEQFCIC